jgi:hypothetical protein
MLLSISPIIMKSAIEIHDSYLTEIAKHDNTVELKLSAYIHKSEGTPLIDAGTGWIQDVSVFLRDGAVNGTITNWPADLYDGTLEVDSDAYENVIPIPLDRQGTIRLTLKPTQDAQSWRTAAMGAWNFTGRRLMLRSFRACTVVD